jgi:hypothetical protein
MRQRKAGPRFSRFAQPIHNSPANLHWQRYLPSSRVASPVPLLLFAPLLGGLLVTDHAASDRSGCAMMHEVAAKTANDGAFMSPCPCEGINTAAVVNARAKPL